ncbi:hypothetical protein TNCT_276161, partial [Trichonephila clavata]
DSVGIGRNVYSGCILINILKLKRLL